MENQRKMCLCTGMLYDNLNDAIDYGRWILPGVRKALDSNGELVKNGKRAANGVNGHSEPEVKKLKA